jgi:probable rRNA maturation factor
MNKFELIKNIDEDIEELVKLQDFINYSVDYLKLENVLFNVIIIDNKEIHEINKTYRGIDRPTDVISFALEDDDTFIETEERILGDIYISIDKAKEQALEYGHSLLRELCFLSIHGLLHLLGYDHMTEEDEKVMFGLQERVLDSYGIKRN